MYPLRMGTTQLLLETVNLLGQQIEDIKTSNLRKNTGESNDLKEDDRIK